MNEKRLLDDYIVLTSHETLFSESGWQLWRYLIRCCLPFLACIFLIGFVGCGVFPTPEHDLLEGRGKIDESDIAFLTVGKTTREDVLLKFGEPDLVLYDQRILIYRWRVIQGYGFILLYAIDYGPVSRDYLFMLEFDGEGRLKRFERYGDYASVEKAIDKWTPPDSEKLYEIERNIILIRPIPTPNAKTVTLDTESRSIRFRVGEFCDSRTSPHRGNLIGHKKYNPNWIIADVRTNRHAKDIVREAVTQQLQVMGHQLVTKDADVAMVGEIAEFGVTTSANSLTWDAIGSLDVILEVQLVKGRDVRIIRRYKAKHVSETFFSPRDYNFEQVMRECLEDMQRQIASDTELIRLLKGKTH